ncbi:MAG: helix-turn-helix domain-containing protein [Burkholderiales bacterium]|nr:MAG: helix-turn-helix domain-containing protein [Burkholderiales bacterium]
MSVRTMAAVWAHSKHGGTELLIMLAIADFADDAGNAYPAVGTLAEKCRMSGRNVNHLLQNLRGSGELEVRQNEGPRGTNRYRIVLPGLEGAKSVQVVAKSQPLKPASPQTPEGGFTPDKPFTLKPVAHTPEARFLEPLKPTSDKPSLNHQRTRESAHAKRAPAADRGSRLPHDWQPSEADRTFCQERRPDLEIAEVAERFRDHWTAQPGAKGRKSDWSATWRNWVRNERGVDGHRTAASPRLLSADEQLMPEAQP